ncbi:alpha/beta hydrolase [Streptomyces sp. NPDC006879]|uniref:alpha/beta hydrolase n=1 Tax=Streptomyces sp. NPDC006879 TaxID=3364767 RepID=UPI0036D0C3D9
MTLDRRGVISMGAGAAALTALGAGSAQASPAARGPRVPNDAALARSLPGRHRFHSRHAQVNGTRLHYVIGGRGEPLVLLPGWPETWWGYRKIMPVLAEHYRVIVVDVRGMGGSATPADGYDKKTMARDVYELVRSLGHRSVHIAGHDIGAMVAFSFAANHPGATRRLALLDVTHPDESLYELRMLLRPNTGFNMWWFAFNQVLDLPQHLLHGRMWTLIDWLFDNALVKQDSVTRFDRSVYARAYDRPGGIRASCAWYQAFHADIEAMAGYGRLAMPVLGMAALSEFDHLAATLERVADDVRGVIPVEKSLHWLSEEDPELVSRSLLDFFG